jgi:hypothetical protein
VSPEGSLVRIAYDGPVLEPGNALVTRTGRTYVIVEVRRQVRGRHAGRQHLRCLVAAPGSFTGKAHPLVWYAR